MPKTLGLHAILRQFEGHRLHVMRDFRPPRVFQNRFQRVDIIHRKRARDPRLIRNAQHRQRQTAIHGGFNCECDRLRRIQPCQARAIRNSFLARLDAAVIARVRVLGRPHLFQQAVELQLLVNLLELGNVGLLRRQIRHLEFNRRRRIDGRQPLAQQNLLAIILQTLAIHLALHFGRVFERALHRAESLGRGQIVPLVFLHRIEHMHAFVDELQHVLVARDDHHVEIFAGAPSHGADHVVGLETRILQHRNAHRLEQSTNIRDLLA